MCALSTIGLDMPGSLRKIRFEEALAEVKSVEHISRVLIRWELRRTSQDLEDLKFFIYRGESPEDLVRLNGEGIDHDELYEYMDYTGHLFNLRKTYYYRVDAVEFDGTTEVQTFSSDIFTWDGDLDLVGTYVVEEHLFLYRYTSAGTPAFIYKKKKEGARCPECWDPILKKVTKSTCTTCRGTGFTGGYYKPIDAWMGFNPSPKISSIADWGEKQVNQTDIEFTDYPILNVGDVVLELKTHKFWKIDNVRYSEKGRVIMTQIARASAVNRSDIEYSIEAPEDRRTALLDLLEEKRKELEF